MISDEDNSSEESYTTSGIRHVRIQQKGHNSSKNMHYLSLSGFEIYGKVISVCKDLGEYW